MASEKSAEMNLSEEQIAIQQDYDEFPYDSYPFPLSHPGRLSTLAKIFGLDAASIDNCRVLELGCASGGNLIPMAASMPNSQFFGIDLSVKQVTNANETIKKLGLKNIKIEHKNILDLTGKIRKFDYIICHGVYSWVPDDVRQKIFHVCKNYLNETGVAYISYNTYPGWHMRESVRHMMRYHTAHIDQPQEKINQSRALLKFLTDSVPATNNPYGSYLKAELQILSNTGDAYLAHEHLERNNSPVYFHQFCEQAAKAGLQYLGESEFHTMLTSNFAPEVTTTLNTIVNDIVRQEQYMDFLRNRTFRSTLLCHKDIVLTRNIDASVIQDLHISAMPMRIVENPSDQENKSSYLTAAGIVVNIGEGLTKKAYEILSKRWPSAIRFDELFSLATEGLESSDDKTRNLMSSDLLKLYTAKAVDLHKQPAQFVMDVSDKPRVSELARLQAQDSYSITNMRHEVARINEPTRRLLLLLDGKSNQQQLLDKMLEMVQKGELILKEDEVEITDEDKQRQYIQQFLQKILQELGKRALLVS